MCLNCEKPGGRHLRSVEYQDEAARTYQQLVVNSKSYASNRPEGRRYMAAMGHYPILLHQGACQIGCRSCIGTGTAVGAVSTHQELQSIGAVDLSPTVFEFAPHFVPINKQFYFANPKVHQIVADGRHFLLGTNETFDVVALAPPPPHDAGDHQPLHRGILRAGQAEDASRQRARAEWVPLDFNRGILPKMILKAMMGQFKHVSLWLPSRMEGIAIALRRTRDDRSADARNADVAARGGRRPDRKRPALAGEFPGDLHRRRFEARAAFVRKRVYSDETIGRASNTTTGIR